MLFNSVFCLLRKHVKQSLYKAGLSLRVPGGRSSHISGHLSRGDGKIVSPAHRLPLPQVIFLVLISLRGWVDPRAIEGIISMKNSNESIGNRTREL